MTTTPTPGATMTTDHRAEALRLLTPGETHDAGEWTRACPTPDQALVHAVLHLADQLRPADVHGADHAREDGTTDPRSGRETGARRDGDLEHIRLYQSSPRDDGRCGCGFGAFCRLAPDNRRYRFEVGDRVQDGDGSAGTVCEASTASHGGGPRYAVLLDGPAWYWESQLEPLPPVEPDAAESDPIAGLPYTPKCRCEACEPVGILAFTPVDLPTTPAEVELLAHVASRAYQERDEARARLAATSAAHMQEWAESGREWRDRLAEVEQERAAHAVRALAFCAERVEIEGELAGAQIELAKARQERDEARAQVARVEALVEANSRAETVYVARVRAALAGPDDAGTGA